MNVNSNFTLMVLTFSFFIALRYLFVASIFHLVFRYFLSERIRQRIVYPIHYQLRQFKSEVKYSLLTCFVFGFSFSLLFFMWQKGYTRIYLEISDYPIWYLPVSLVVILLIHETYYYWLYRLMHKPLFYKVIHKIHHDSLVTSAWTSFSFHPLESLLQVFIFFPIVYLLPLHPIVIIIHLTIMSVTSVINHINIELYPKHILSGFFNLWIGATHHALHHKQFKTNYGLYFRFWDVFCATESHDFKNLYDIKRGN